MSPWWFALLAGCGAPRSPPIFHDITAIRVHLQTPAGKVERWMSQEQGRDLAICLLTSYPVARENAKGDPSPVWDITVTDAAGVRTFVLVNDRTLQKGRQYYANPCALPLVRKLDLMSDHL